MKQYFSYILLGSSALLFFFTFFASSGTLDLRSLRDQHDLQYKKKQEVEERVSEMRAKWVGMEENPRVLEKVAREELRVTRDNETIILFEKP